MARQHLRSCTAHQGLAVAKCGAHSVGGSGTPRRARPSPGLPSALGGHRLAAGTRASRTHRSDRSRCRTCPHTPSQSPIARAVGVRTGRNRRGADQTKERPLAVWPPTSWDHSPRPCPFTAWWATPGPTGPKEWRPRAGRARGECCADLDVEAVALVRLEPTRLELEQRAVRRPRPPPHSPSVAVALPTLLARLVLAGRD